jgi:hypothetical protein
MTEEELDLLWEYAEKPKEKRTPLFIHRGFLAKEKAAHLETKMAA